MATTISDGVNASIKEFQVFLQLLRFDQESAWMHDEVDDQFTRFIVWSRNIGAHKTGRKSMEYRLRDASHIRIQALNLLGQLKKMLEDASAIIKGERVPWDKLPDDDDDDDEDDEEEDDDEEDDDDDDEDDGFPSTEIEQIVRHVGTTIGCLLRLSVAIQNPAPHDRFRNARETDTSSYEPFDILHVRNKFPDLDRIIAERLGKTNTLRRQYFKYREARHMKLAQGLEASEASEAPETPQSPEALEDPDRLDPGPLDGTLASSIPGAMIQATSFDLGITPVDEDEESITGSSQTSFATSVSTGDRPSIPPRPAEAQRGPFECPFCYMMISASTKRSWKKHVFGDLRPYICLHRDCEMPAQDYGRRYEWIAHDTHYHKTKWAQCPFCNDALAPDKEYYTHVARHQEELALFALPHTDIPGKADDDDDEDDGEDDTDSDDSLEDESASLQELVKAVQTNKKTLGPNHPITLTSRSNLATAYLAHNHFDESIKLHGSVMEARRTTLGDDHPDTLRSMVSIATLSCGIIRATQAERLWDHVIKVYKTTLGPDHPNTLHCMDGLASLYRQTRRPKEAEKLWEQVIKARKTTLGADHLNTLQSMAALASLYQREGRLREAEKLQSQVMETRKTKLGPDHPDTLEIAAGLAETWGNLGHNERALELMGDCLSRYARLSILDEMTTLFYERLMEKWR